MFKGVTHLHEVERFAREVERFAPSLANLSTMMYMFGGEEGRASRELAGDAVDVFSQIPSLSDLVCLVTSDSTANYTNVSQNKSSSKKFLPSDILMRGMSEEQSKTNSKVCSLC